MGLAYTQQLIADVRWLGREGGGGGGWCLVRNVGDVGERERVDVCCSPIHCAACAELKDTIGGGCGVWMVSRAVVKCNTK